MSKPEDSDVIPEKSKSQKKREALALQEMGTELTQLSEEQLQSILLPEKLYDAIIIAKNIRQHGGQKRQLQFIGKLMRDIDPEPIQLALKAIQRQRAIQTKKHHQIEHWRDQLLLHSSEAIAELAAEFPQLERQYIHQLVRNADQEKQQQKPPKSARKLFRYLQQLSAPSSD